MNALAVAVGSVLGSLARWQAGVWLNTRWAGGFPLGTLLVNLLGGLMIGAALEWFGRQPNDVLKLLLITGFLGGMTTFSAFTGESLTMLRGGHFALALAHTASHVLGALAAAACGMRLMQFLLD